MSGKKMMKRLIILVFILCNVFLVTAQTVVKGFVKDAITKRPIAFASVVFKNGKGVSTGEDGSYSIETNNKKLTNLIFSYVGYSTVTKEIKTGIEQTLEIELELSSSMKEVVVKRGKGKYRNKNNPAVELIDRVIENKEKNRIKAYDYVQYEQYEKIGLSFANKPEKLQKNLIFKKYKFIMDNIDTTTLKGRSLLPVYLEEKLYQKYYRKNPEENKTYILGEKQVNYGDFFDRKGVSTYINSLYANINIYDNNIVLLNQQFLSPIANVAPAFYRYYITDTTEIDGIKLARLYFTPKNPSDLIFRGSMFITLDGNYSIQKIDLTISKKANINWTKELKISQDFEKGLDGRYHVIKSDMLAEFVITNNSTGGVIGERLVTYKNYQLNKPAPDSIYLGKDLVDLTNKTSETDSFWVNHRHKKLSSTESKAYVNIDTLQQIKSFRRFASISAAIFSGYVDLGKYQIGNINSFYSFNPIEGFRLRAGGRTTEKLNKNFYFENYLAYGFLDKQFKYLASGTYSFNHKSIYSFPFNYLKVGYQYDMNIPGQELEFVQESNFLLSFKRGVNDRWLYNNIFKIEYVREFGKNIAFSMEYKNWKQTPAGSIVYQKQPPGNEIVPDITTSEIKAELRWAPNEQYYQDKGYRISIINKYPIFKFRYIVGIKGLLNGAYNYQKVNLYMEKRIYLSQLGFLDFTGEGGIILGELPFSLLTIHRANQSYGYQLASYNLMNFLEFVSDKYASAFFDLHLNGFLFNKIPFIKKLNLREVASAKILYGSIRDENNPDKNPNQILFPKDAVTGTPTTFSLNGKPYIEVSVGVANIFKLVRVDLVKRITYLDNPGVTQWGIRSRFKFDF